MLVFTIEHSLVGLDTFDPDQGFILRDLGAQECFLKTKLTPIENVASIESSFTLKQVKDTNSRQMGTPGA